jgi:hypothetical protein
MKLMLAGSAYLRFTQWETLPDKAHPFYRVFHALKMRDESSKYFAISSLSKPVRKLWKALRAIEDVFNALGLTTPSFEILERQGPPEAAAGGEYQARDIVRAFINYARTMSPLNVFRARWSKLKGICDCVNDSYAVRY